ncbi:pyroglutamyl-peptidase 1 isoform X2 [Drosophila hydei]|nr:pyroglutamyl-peptidase 1 isoform X2 [Drosophila hydei]XP_023164444.1 pyroglutamyl-peptidase 1 isoform X2 [Drosophila hydei]
MSSTKRKQIVVTGFGPFVGHEEVNASWEAVQLLPENLSYNDIDYQLEQRMVPVEYESVDEAVAEIWQGQPELVVHVGVSGVAKCVYVEKLAYNHQFRRPDNAGKYLEKGTCPLPQHGHANVLRCGLDVDTIVRVVNSACKDCVATAEADKTLGATMASKNVGSFLCGYIYLKSLDINCNRSLFVHVPPIDKPFSTSQTADILYRIIEQCIQQISAFECQ